MKSVFFYYLHKYLLNLNNSLYKLLLCLYIIPNLTSYMHGMISIGCVTIFLHAPQAIVDDGMYKMAWDYICELGMVPTIILMC